MWLIF